jgi:DNA invertase Pin-like site-specific DNA recombinase
MRIMSYLRVSTARQGASGLGLEAQRAAVAAFAAAGGHVIISEYVEVESGAKAARP